MNALKDAKKADDDNQMYADDGNNVQCYHTEDTIRAEFGSAGLRITEALEKVYYPWDLTREFDYGYFPDADEEIWDWFVVAEKVR